MAPAPGNSSVWVTSLTGESRAHKAQDTSSAARRELALQPPSCLPRPMFWRGTTGASPGGLGRVCCRATCDSGPNPVPWVCPLRRRKMHRKQPAVNPSPTPGRDPTETRGPLQRVSRAGGSPAAGGGVGGAGWARGAAPVRMDGCEGGVQPGCWGRGAQTASGPHTQGLSSGSSRRRRWVFRPLTALSACQAPIPQCLWGRTPELRRVSRPQGTAYCPVLSRLRCQSHCYCHTPYLEMRMSSGHLPALVSHPLPL